MLFSRVLVISPHTDDAELGSGGTIAKFIERGNEVYYAFFSHAEKSVPEGQPNTALINECINANKILKIPPSNLLSFNYEVRNFSSLRQNILEDLVHLRKEISPDLVIVPSSNDVHQDHQVIQLESLRAFKTNTSIWGYEHPWNNFTFTTDIFNILNESHLKIKIMALKQYISQADKPYFSESYITSLARTRGCQVGSQYAEAFEVMRIIIK
jgi:LmbE family N-acetylglucosaminyl deacetylase